MANTTRLSSHGADECLHTEDPSYLVPHCLRALHSSIPIWKELAHCAQRSLYIFIFSKYGKLSPNDLRALTLYLLYKGRAYVHGILVSSVPLYKHQDSSSLRHVKISSFYTYRIIGDPSVTNLNFQKVFSRHSTGALYKFFIFCSSSTSNHCTCGQLTHFVHHQLELVDQIVNL